MAWVAANPLRTPIVDLLLVHTGKAEQVKDVAEALWYPIWDSKVGLDHAVRTPDQALRVAQDDVKALLSLLAVRHITGDTGVSGPLRERLLDLWRATAPKRAPELREICSARWRIAGDARVPARAQPEGRAGRP